MWTVILMENVYPVLTPMAVDASRPFPLIRNKTLNIAALLSKKNTRSEKQELDFATVQVPAVLPRHTNPRPEEENAIMFYSAGADHREKY